MYRIGELADLAGVSARTIDYYTKLELIFPESRSPSNYRFYSEEALSRLRTIEVLKREKYSLEEIKQRLDGLTKLDTYFTEKVERLAIHLEQVEKDYKDLEPIFAKLKPGEIQSSLKHLSPHTLSCLQSLLLLLNDYL